MGLDHAGIRENFQQRIQSEEVLRGLENPVLTRPMPLKELQLTAIRAVLWDHVMLEEPLQVTRHVGEQAEEDADELVLE